ncbi:hypothetical protein AB0F91_21325 [Amycolatopsis sp. NPDC023774]|uniref:hypothetical protein n=1 Tax=Amycolatopsis sp. NPDC023774 TaxID=3155015 RepID=UPI0033D8ECDF
MGDARNGLSSGDLPAALRLLPTGLPPAPVEDAVPDLPAEDACDRGVLRKPGPATR